MAAQVHQLKKTVYLMDVLGCTEECFTCMAAARLVIGGNWAGTISPMAGEDAGLELPMNALV